MRTLLNNIDWYQIRIEFITYYDNSLEHRLDEYLELDFTRGVIDVALEKNLNALIKQNKSLTLI